MVPVILDGLVSLVLVGRQLSSSFLESVLLDASNYSRNRNVDPLLPLLHRLLRFQQRRIAGALATFIPLVYSLAGVYARLWVLHISSRSYALELAAGQDQQRHSNLNAPFILIRITLHRSQTRARLVCSY